MTVYDARKNSIEICIDAESVINNINLKITELREKLTKYIKENWKELW